MNPLERENAELRQQLRETQGNLRHFRTRYKEDLEGPRLMLHYMKDEFLRPDAAQLYREWSEEFDAETELQCEGDVST